MRRLKVTVAAMVAVGSVGTSAFSQDLDRGAVRNDALLLMGAGLAVPGLAAYCNKYVAADRGLIDAAARWNKRNDAAMRLILEAIEWSGGLTGAEREQLDILAYKTVEQMVGENDGAICGSMEGPIEEGLVDLDVREDTAPALKRLQSQFQ